MFDNINEVKKSVSQSISERISNPIVSSFIISWIIFNWQIILILLFSDRNIEIKIGAIIAVGSWFNSLISPLFSSALYVIAIPYVLEQAYKIQNGPFKRAQDKLADRTDYALARKKTTEVLRAEADIAYNTKTKNEEVKIEEMQLSINNLKERNGEKERELLELEEVKENLRISCENLTNEVKNLKSLNQDLIAEKAIINNEISEKHNDLLAFRDASQSLMNEIEDLSNASGITPTIRYKGLFTHTRTLCNKYNKF
ncbi:hypothetical protein [Pantoea allii]|uniref:hypothetical protein n=1 Tax=Pantoea allii TaxID=574096 RepID=UPI003D316E92